MTVKRVFTVTVSMDSECSEASLSEHCDNFVKDVQQSLKDAANRSWHKSISTSWDETYPVAIDVEIKP